MVEQYHAIGDVFFQPVSCERFFAAFARDHGRYSAVLQPAKQAPELGTQDALVTKARKQRFERVQRYTFRSDGVDRVTQPDEQPFQVVFAGLLDLAAFDADVVERYLVL